MNKGLLFYIFCFLLFNQCHGFTIEIKLVNPSDIPLTCSVSLVRSYTDEYGNWWPNFGFITKNGITKGNIDIEKYIQPHSESYWVKLPVSGRILVCTRVSQKPVEWMIDVKLVEKDNVISRSIKIPEKQPSIYVYFFTVPVSPGPVKLEILTAEEIVDRNYEIARQSTKGYEGKNPQKIAIYTDLHLTEKDPPEYRKKQYLFLKQAGFNGLMYASSSLLPEIVENGFLYIRTGGASIGYDDYYKKNEEIELKTRENALDISGIFERYNVIKNVRNLKLGDEISSGLVQDYLSKGEDTRLGIIEYLKEKNIPPGDFGVSSYEKIKISPAGIMKIENPALYYWVNRIRMERINNLWKYVKQANKKYFPYAWSSPNWPVSAYLDGGYQDCGWDLWHLYQNKNLDGIWGEDWPGYEVWLRGGNSYLVDMMRCQAKGLPMGIYNVVESSYSPVYARYKFYEQMIRGITEIFWYSYGCLRGNESNPWEIKTDIVREISLLNHQAGEAEKYLLNTNYEPAQIAILWTPAQEIWNPLYHNEIIALYYTLLHANYNIDFISSYDVEDDILKNYKVLYMPFSYVENNVWTKIKKWVEDGGFLVIEDGHLYDQYNKSIDIGAWLKGFSSINEKRTSEIGRLPIELPRQKVIDFTEPVAFPVVCSKTVLSMPENGICLLKYKDGKPAAIQVKKGKGTVRITGFYQGISYVWDQEKRDKSRWGDVLLYHGFSPELRKFTVEPAKISGIKNVCDIDKEMVVARKRTGKHMDCIALFDYGFGTEKPIMPVWDEIKETTVKLEIKSANNIKCLGGKIKKETKDTYSITFKGVAIILIDK